MFNYLYKVTSLLYGRRGNPYLGRGSIDMSIKKFLTPFAVLAATFSCEQAVAAHAPEVSPTNNIQSLPSAEGNNIFAFNLQGDEHSFILKRSSDAGILMAWHESHASHASHASHRSHYSSRY